MFNMAAMQCARTRKLLAMSVVVCAVSLFATAASADAAPDTIVGDAMPALPDLTPAIPVTSSPGGASFECRLNNGSWNSCTPSSGSYAGSFNDAAANKLEIRAVDGSGTDPTPATTYIWTDDDADPSATASVTPTTTDAGAHPDVSATVNVIGGWNPKDVTINLPPGLNGALTGTPDLCTVAEANAGTCDTNAPGSEIGTLSGTGTSTRDGFVNATGGTLYLTESPDSSSPAGIALELDAPNSLGKIIALGRVRISQTNNSTSNGLVRQQIYIPNIPQKTAAPDNNRFHINSVTIAIDADPDGSPSTYPLLTNPTSCPGSPAQFSGSGTTYETDGTDNASSEVVSNVTVDYPVTNCNALSFNPSISQDFFMPDPIDGSTWDPSAPVVQNVGQALETNDSLAFTRYGIAGAEADVSLPSGHSSIKDIVAHLPTGVGANYPSFGTSGQRCAGSTASTTSIFTAASCPATAKVGTLTIDSPLLATDVVGDILLINKTPLPWLGVNIVGGASGNPPGLSMRLTGTTDISGIAGCSGSGAPWCGDRIKLSFAGVPDIPISNINLDLSGATARSNGVLESLIMTVIDEGDPDCHASDVSRTVFTPHNGGSSATRDVNTTLSPC